MNEKWRWVKYAKYVFGAKSENNVVRAASFEVGLGDADQMK